MSWQCIVRRLRTMLRGLRPERLRGLPLLLLAAAAPLINGCVSKSTAQAQARAAFLEGQRQAMQQSQMQQAQTQVRGPTIALVGPVKNSLLPWTVDLTLAKALIFAEYYGPTDPGQIVIVREGHEVRVDPKKLLSGEDIPLQPQDVIEIH